jgi:mannosyltransferase OCH1-like enzyme
MQTWKNNDVPERWKASPESVQEKMPDWEYHLMTDEMNREFVKSYFPDFLSTYDGFQYPIQRADAIRYMWLYIHGGVYMDLDIVLTKPLDGFFESNCDIYLVHSGNIGSYYTNALMASKKGCSLWLECLEEMKISVESPSPLWIGRHFHVMNTTGPMMLTRVARRSNLVIGNLPSKLLIPCSLCDLPCRHPDEAYAYAIPGSSWITWDTMIYSFFLCHWKEVVAFFVFLLFLILIFILAWWLRPRYERRRGCY